MVATVSSPSPQMVRFGANDERTSQLPDVFTDGHGNRHTVQIRGADGVCLTTTESPMSPREIHDVGHIQNQTALQVGLLLIVQKLKEGQLGLGKAFRLFRELLSNYQAQGRQLTQDLHETVAHARAGVMPTSFQYWPKPE